jgi:hypothetical protein
MMHDQFELAIEQQLHGALGASEAEALADHLATCAACRDYGTHARGSNADLAHALAPTAALDWTAVSARAHRLARRVRRVRYVSPAVMVAVVTTEIMVKEIARGWTTPIRILIAELVVFAVIFGGIAWRLARKTVHKQEAELARDGAIAFYRAWTARKIRSATRLRWLQPMLAAWLLVIAYTTRDPEIVLLTAIYVPLGVASAIWWALRLPQLRRESAELC